MEGNVYHVSLENSDARILTLQADSDYEVFVDSRHGGRRIHIEAYMP